MTTRYAAETTLLAKRLVGLLDYLGIERAHFATQMPGDLTDFASQHAVRIAGLAFVVPVRLDPAPFGAMSARTLILTGDSGVSVEPSRRGAERLAGASLLQLKGYATTGWSDIARERAAEVVAAVRAGFGKHTASNPRSGAPREGVHAGITFRIDGSGPALILMPFFLAASQWEPIVPQLSEHFTVIRIGGAHVGGIAILEERAAQPSYQAMFRTLVDLMDLPAGARVLDVGCGSGALDRAMAKRLGDGGRVDAIDINGYLRGEAAALARADGLGDVIHFAPGSAEAIPFPDNTFDGVFSVTVLEECNADRAIAEIVRVVKPGRAVGLIVRAIDMPQWWSFDIPSTLQARANLPPQSVGAGGVADKSLYPRMQKAGLVDLVPFPMLTTIDQPGNSVWRYREDHLAAQFSPDEFKAWRAARDQAAKAGTLFQSHAVHCAVARKRS